VELVAFYSGQSGLSVGGATSDKTPAQLQRIEAKQKVLVTSKDGQTATGDWAIFDVKANTVLLGGRVVVTRGKDVAEGPRLKIALTTGMYRFEVENEPTSAAVPAVSSAPPATEPGKAAAETDPSKRSCPAGKQCLLFYPNDSKDRAKEAGKKILSDPAKTIDGWRSSTS